MKKSIFILTTIIFLSNTSCLKRDPEFTIDGISYYTNERCIKDSSWTEYCWHYGYNFWTGKWEYHWGFDTKSECLEYKIDTIVFEN